jgi:histidinol-phosphate/aromatic aminotransferase/cobyric acid decarboxylase-like protein
VRSIAGQLSRALAAATPYVLPCNPNNPTAARHSRQALVDTASQLQLQGGWLIVDAAFIDPTPETVSPISPERLCWPRCAPPTAPTCTQPSPAAAS